MREVGSGLVLTFCVLSLALAGGCGGDGDATQERIDRERRDAAEQARQEERIKQLEREQRNLQKKGSASGDGSGGSGGISGGGSSAGSGRTQCGGGLEVGANTTCAFAREVRDEYNRSDGDSRFTAHSPVTGKDYSMSCTSGSPHVCTGGNGASVYFP